MLEIEVMHLIGIQDYFVFLKVKFIFIGLLPEFEFEFSLLNRFAMYERRHKIWRFALSGPSWPQAAQPGDTFTDSFLLATVSKKS